VLSTGGNIAVTVPRTGGMSVGTGTGAWFSAVAPNQNAVAATFGGGNSILRIGSGGNLSTSITALNGNSSAFQPLIVSGASIALNPVGYNTANVNTFDVTFGRFVDLKWTNNAAAGTTSVVSQAVDDSIMVASRNNMTIKSSNTIVLSTLIGDSVYVAANGDTGFGISPSSKLHVKNPTDANPIAIIAGNTFGIRLGTTINGGVIEGVDSTGVTSFQQLTIGGSNIRFTTNGINVGIWNGTGLAIGNQNPSATIHASRTTDTNPIAIINGATHAIRIGTSSSAALIDAVDQTGITSYKALRLTGVNVSVITSGATGTGYTFDKDLNMYSTTPGTTTMANGFIYIPSAGGVPTGVPLAVGGHVPMYYDATNNNFYVYNGGWKKVFLS
jgi:hypothetical protein